MLKNLKDTYLGNAKLKKAGVKQEFTPEQIQEFVRCSQDPMYFIKKYVKIVDQNKGFVLVDPYPYQEKLVTQFNDNRFSIVLCSRRTGKTTAYIIFVLWFILFNEHKNIYILANRAKGARSILSRVRDAYEALPMWLQQGVMEWNKGSIELENGCKVVADSTSSSAARGENIDVLILDEFAFVPNSMQDEFWRSVYPTITAGKSTKVIIVSTPNGLNMFYKLWEDAKAGRNSYVPFTVHWTEVPGRDEKWVKDTIANMGKAGFEQEYELDFIGASASTLIPSKSLRNLVYATPLYSKECLDVYAEPLKEKEYLITVDVSRGEEKDFSAFVVFDITQMPYTIVAKYRNNKISPMEYPSVIVNTARKYNEAMLLVELNDTGGEVADIIKNDFEYDNMFTTMMDKKFGQPKLSIEHGKKFKLGVMTSRTVKNVGCANLKSMIEENQLIVRDFDIISELSTFKSRGSSFAAEKGASDDLAMSLVLFSWLTGQKYFKELSKSSIRNVVKEKAEEEMIRPIVGDSEENQVDVLEAGDLIIVSEATQNADQWMEDAYSTALNNYHRFRN